MNSVDKALDLINARLEYLGYLIGLQQEKLSKLNSMGTSIDYSMIGKVTSDIGVTDTEIRVLEEIKVVLENEENNNV